MSATQLLQPLTESAFGAELARYVNVNIGGPAPPLGHPVGNTLVCELGAGCQPAVTRRT
jgi:hypothetical protein